MRKVTLPHLQTLNLQQIVAYLHFSQWDYTIFLDCFTKLIQELENVSVPVCQEIYKVLHNICKNYYFIGEAKEQPFHLGMLFYKIGYYVEVIEFLEYSLCLYSKDPGMYYNKAKCYYQLQSLGKALEQLDRALEIYPQFEEAQMLKSEIESSLVQE